MTFASTQLKIRGFMSHRRRVMAGNWKMYKTLAETRAFFSAFIPAVAKSHTTPTS